MSASDLHMNTVYNCKSREGNLHTLITHAGCISQISETCRHSTHYVVCEFPWKFPSLRLNELCVTGQQGQMVKQQSGRMHDWKAMQEVCSSTQH